MLAIDSAFFLNQRTCNSCCFNWSYFIFLEGKELPTVINNQPKDFKCGRHNPTFMELLLRMIVGENIAENLFSKLLMSYDLF